MESLKNAFKNATVTDWIDYTMVGSIVAGMIFLAWAGLAKADELSNQTSEISTSYQSLTLGH